MWPLQPLSHAIVVVTITSEYISCCWIEEKIDVPVNKAYAKYELLKHEVMDAVIYNLSHMRDLIRTFLNQHQLTNAYILIACESLEKKAYPQHIMQLQLLSLMVPMNCIFITSYNMQQNSIQNESSHTISLYKEGKKLLS